MKETFDAKPPDLLFAALVLLFTHLSLVSSKLTNTNKREGYPLRTIHEQIEIKTLSQIKG